MKAAGTITGTIHIGMITTLGIGTAIEGIGPTATTGTNSWKLASERANLEESGDRRMVSALQAHFK